MSAEIKKEIQLEIAHVLFIDIVGYSKLLINEQRAFLDTLNQIVRGTEEFRSAEASGRLIKIPTGDGMALVFYNSPEAPVECALEISRALKEHPELRLRMGVHSGPVSGMVDVNDRANVAGAGINVAQRVMDCGDAGHILLSKHVAEDLEQYGHWQPHLHELGACEVKHGSRVHVVNLYTEELGNPEAPEKFRQAKETQTAPAIPASDTKPAGRSWGLIVALIVVAAVATAGYLIFSHRSGSNASDTSSARPSTSAAVVPEKSIAVLPFQNLSEDKENAYFANGIRDEILTKLAQMEDLRVVARTSADKFQSQPEDIRTVGRQLNVATALEGSVQKAGEEVLINVQLIDARTNTHRWAQSYKRSFKNIFDLEGEVAQKVATELKVKLAPEETHRVQSAATMNTHAHDLFLRGRALNARSDEQSFQQAINLLQQAVAEDPHYAAAWAELANVYLTIADAYRAPIEVLDPMRNAALMAVRSDGKYGPGHVWFGAIAMLYDRNFALAKGEFERAVALDSNSSEAHRWLGYYLGAVERNYAAARTELRQAETLDPLNPWTVYFESGVAIAQGDYEAALMLAQRTLEIDPRFFYGTDPIADVYLAMGRWQDGIKRYESQPSALRNRPNFELAICFAHAGETDRARQILKQLETLATTVYIDKTQLAGVYAALGDRDEAFAALDRAADDRSANVIAMRSKTWLAPLFNDPRFASFEYKIAHSAISASPDITP